MFRVCIFLCIATQFISCSRPEIRHIDGEFLFYDDAAVLKGPDFIYGVEIDDNAIELARRVKPLKNEEFDMIMVTVKGSLKEKDKASTGWDSILTIKEIVDVGN